MHVIESSKPANPRVSQESLTDINKKMADVQGFVELSSSCDDGKDALLNFKSVLN